MEEKHILIICGEASGEIHAASLARAIKKTNPEIKISGIGSDLLRQAGVEVFYDIKGLAVLGLFDALKKLPQFFALKDLVLEKIKRDHPDAIIFVDFSGFNLRLAKVINNKIPTIYYVSPQVWASRPGRVKTIKKYISKVIVIFPFEKEFYNKYGVDVDFVGHPLLDIVEPVSSKEEFLRECGFSADKKTIALLPGSRKSEITQILPLMLKSGQILSQKIPGIQFVVAKSTQVEAEVYEQVLAKFDLNLKVIESKTYDCLNIADFALVASGTATLETAIMGKPLAVIYKMNLLNYLLYRPQVKLPYIGMVNIVAGEKIVEEFIQFGAAPRKIADYVLEIIANPQKLNSIKEKLSSLRNSLGETGAALRAAQIIIRHLNS